ncbi:MAG: hypothetical protein ACKO96_08515, partial [Flammeovirgaceae bacterium]
PFANNYEEDGVEERDEQSLRNSNRDIKSLSDADLNYLLKKALKKNLTARVMPSDRKYYYMTFV